MNHQDQIRGCIVGGAAGDALGYAIEFKDEDEIFSRYGEAGITAYEPDKNGKALISDDTQMVLFTANGLLVGDTRGALRGIQAEPRHYVARAYQDWLHTQEAGWKERSAYSDYDSPEYSSWLMDVPELYHRRAPGNTCLAALEEQKRKKPDIHDYIRTPQNNRKGCGGVMRVAPMALDYGDIDIRQLDLEGAQIAAITHGHSLGYMPAAVLTHVIHQIVFPEKEMGLKETVLEARDTAAELFREDPYLPKMTEIINRAVELSENGEPDLINIHRLGQGWVAEEALAIALYCALRHQDDFSAGIIAAANHKGDSDSTAAVAGNILGARLGYSALEDKWKDKLEMMDVLLEIADDLDHGCQMSEYSKKEDKNWLRKYVHMRR